MESSLKGYADERCVTACPRGQGLRGVVAGPWLQQRSFDECGGYIKDEVEKSKRSATVITAERIVVGAKGESIVKSGPGRCSQVYSVATVQSCEEGDVATSSPSKTGTKKGRQRTVSAVDSRVACGRLVRCTVTLASPRKRQEWLMAAYATQW